MAQPRRVSCGLDFCTVPDLSNSLQIASEAAYHFICCPIVHPRYKREFINGKCKNRAGSFTRSDLLLTSTDWSNLIVGKLSSYIDADSKNETIRKQSEQALMQELGYAAHLGLPAILFCLRGPNMVNTARIIHNKMLPGSCFQVWVHCPLTSAASRAGRYRSDIDTDESNALVEDTWDWWNQLHLQCNFERRLGVALEMTEDLPSEEYVNRWLGEPVKAVILATKLFLTNKKGYPVLSRVHQQLLKKFALLNVQVIISGCNRHNYIKYYQQYLEHLWQSAIKEDALATFARGYEDFLQCPLQPLMDNLESQTYEVFEKDPVKYTEYQKAIYHYLLDRVPFSEKEIATVVIMVVGAGRGPLVRASFNAAEKADRKIRIYAVEKNPNAVVTLLALKDEMWGDLVTVVSSDMREWNPPEQADLIVSELLGSFGDNELSPECLDGAQKFLKPDGQMIPTSYTSYISPIQSSRILNEVRQCQERFKHPKAHFETPYVVHLQNRTELALPQPLFTFKHPNYDDPIDNTRYQIRHFQIQQKGILHGFAGYFDTVLYGDVGLSILPQTHSQGMFSWFPIFFPLKEPIVVPCGVDVEVHFWRLTNRKSVWYEWSVTKPQQSTVHNPNGRSYTIGL